MAQQRRADAMTKPPNPAPRTRAKAKEMMTLAERMGGHRFKVGQRVRLSEYGRQSFIMPRTHIDARGTVINVDEFGCPTVKWDYRRTASSYNWAFITPIARRQ